MSRHVFIGTIISKPKIRLLVYRGLLPLIHEPVYIKSSKCTHTEPYLLCARKGSPGLQESGVAPGNWAK